MFLLVNVDDFRYTQAVNRVVVRAICRSRRS